MSATEQDLGRRVPTPDALRTFVLRPTAAVPARLGVRTRWGLLSCILLAVVVRAAAFVIVGHPEIRRGQLLFWGDEASFHETAAALAATGRYSQKPGGPATAFRPPGAILPLAALYYLLRPTPYIALAYVLLCGVGIVVVAHRLAYATCGDERVAVAAALLAAVMPTQVFTSVGIWSEPQAMLLTLLLLYLLIRRDVSRASSSMREGSPPYQGGGRGGGLSRRGTSWALIGLCASLAYLTRPSAGTLFPFLVVGALLSGRSWTRASNTALLLCALLLPIGIWGLRNWWTFGEFITGATVAGEALYGSNNPVTAGMSLPAQQTSGPFDLYREAREGRYLGSWVPMRYIPGWETETNAEASELEVYHRQMASTKAFMRDQPRAGVRLLGYKIVRVLTVEPYAPSVTNDVGTRRVAHRAVTLIEHWFILVWGIVGMLLLFRSRNAARYWYCGFLLAGLANVLVTYPNPRFLLPFTSILIVPAALALTRVWDGRRLVKPAQPRDNS